MHYRIVEWEKYQHYKDRSPPWIKLYRSLLTSETWILCDDASRVLAIACMVIASTTDNKIPCDPKYMKRVAYLNDEPNYEHLLRCNFIQLVDDASNMLASCYQDAIPEQSRAEQSKEEQSRAETLAATPASLPDSLSATEVETAALSERLRFPYAKAGPALKTLCPISRDEWENAVKETKAKGANSVMYALACIESARTKPKKPEEVHSAANFEICYRAREQMKKEEITYAEYSRICDEHPT
jgi:hypothetical protein